MSGGRHEHRGSHPAIPMTLPRLVLLTDRSQLRLGRGLARTVRECADAGLEAVVVREHDLEPARRRALVETLAGIDGLTVISSRIPDPAADGLHLASHRAAPTTTVTARTRAPGGSLAHRRVGGRSDTRSLETPWGRSCHSRDDVADAAREGASWVTLSPYAATISKPGHGPALPASAYADHPVPVLALGGITAGRAAGAVAAGAHGVAVMGAVMRAADPAGEVAALLRELRC